MLVIYFSCFYFFAENWQLFINIGLVCLTGYLMNFVPHFFMEKTLFLHHYLPSLIYQLLIMVTLLEHIETLLPRKYYHLIIPLILSIATFFFLTLLPLSYGANSMSAEDINSLKLLKSWNLLIHK